MDNSLSADKRLDHEAMAVIHSVVVMASGNLFPDSLKRQAEAAQKHVFGKLMTLEDLRSRYDPVQVDAFIEIVIRHRQQEIREAAEQQGVDSPCHVCGALTESKSVAVAFALARNKKTKIHWGTFVIFLLLNFITIPLGFRMGARPGSTTTADLARCRLVMCAACGAKRRGWFFRNAISPKASDFMLHPSWGRLHRAGYVDLISPTDLIKFTPASSRLGQ